MGQTATEKMLQAASNDGDVSAGDTVEAAVDRTWIHETQIGIFREKFEELGGNVWDPERAIFMIDHHPNPTDQTQADRLHSLESYAGELGVDVYKVGIKHQAWRMLGFAWPGAIMVGPDSHTPTAGALGAFAASIGPTDTAVVWDTGRVWMRVPETIRIDVTGALDDLVTPRDIGFSILEQLGQETDYFAENNTIEYGGEAIEGMSLDGRQTLCNMATEMGVTNAFIKPDDRLREEYLDPKVESDYEVHTSDEDASFIEEHHIDVDELEPKVAFPHSPSNVYNVSEAEGIEIDQVFLGSCANGHLEDLRLAADVIEGHEVPTDVDFYVTPATDEIRKAAATEGILTTFTEAGARVSSDYCSVCPGYEGVLAEGEVCLSTSTRNYQGRMGHRNSEVYLGSPATIAASAATGEITNPIDFVEDYA